MTTVNNSASERWIVYAGMGGYVCAVSDPAGPEGICGMPTETEPCDQHRKRTS